MGRLEKILLAAAALASAAAAVAAETITYHYDPRGRVATITHNGTVNGNLVVSHSFDDADNLTNKTISGAQ